MDGNRHAALSDAALDRELDTALNVDPSPEFQARVRLSVARDGAPTGWRFDWRLCGAAAAVAAFAVAAVLFWPAAEPTRSREAGTTAPGAAPSAAADPAPEPASGPVVPRRPAAVMATAVARPEQRATTATPETPAPMIRLPEVIVSPDEVRAYQMLLGIAEQQRVPFPREATPADTDVVYLHTLQLASLTIEALPPLARLEGDRP